MSVAEDWSAVDMNSSSLPANVSSSDLFDGELFGDELIDIYNTTVEAHSGNDEIGNLLAPSEAKKGGEDAEEMLASIDDGFGTFRPSTSFNDLSALLSSVAEGAVANARSEVPVAEEKSTKKRAAPHGAASSPKRKATAVRHISMSKRDEAAAKKTTTAKCKTDKPALTPLTTATAVLRATVAPIPRQITTTVVTNLPLPAAVKSSTCLIKQEETDYKTMAQAAVSSLVQCAVSDPIAAAAASEFSSEKVDVSTAHIKALTGNNWVAACAGTNLGISSVSDDVDSKGSGSGNRNRRQNLTPDERARQNRDRNREHARNTRLRKKAYVEELKRALTELVAQRDAVEFEKRQAVQRELEQREVRFRVIEEFLKLRGRNETNFARWAAILEDKFTLTIPSTDFRKMTHGEAVSGVEKVLNGVSDVMADANTFSEFMQTLGQGEGTVTCQYHCDRENFFMDGCQAVLEWTATSAGAVNKGLSSEFVLKGIVRGKFSPASNKLVSASVACDTGAVLIQLLKHSGASTRVDPSFLEDARAAACHADSILDSLQMPCIQATVPTPVIVHPSSSSSEGSCDKGELDSDDSVEDPGDKSSMENEYSLMGLESNFT